MAGHSLSELVGRLHGDLIVLVSLDQHGMLEPSRARRHVERLIHTKSLCHGPFVDRGWIFASPQAASGIVMVCGRNHASADHAAIDETDRFLRWLWESLDREDLDATMAAE